MSFLVIRGSITNQRHLHKITVMILSSLGNMRKEDKTARGERGNVSAEREREREKERDTHTHTLLT